MKSYGIDEIEHFGVVGGSTGAAEAAKAVERAMPRSGGGPAVHDALTQSVETEFPTDANPKDAIGQAKTPLRLFPPTALVMGAHVMALGAKKYGEYNWRKNAVKHSVYLEAAMRHILLALDGEDADDESGLPPEAHAMMCMAIVIDAMKTGNLIDDRNKTGSVGMMMGMLEEKGMLPLSDV